MLILFIAKFHQFFKVRIDFCSELNILYDLKFLSLMKLIFIMQETVYFVFFQQSILILPS